MTPENTDHGYWPDEVSKPGTPAHHHAEVLHDRLAMARLGATTATATAARPPAIEPSRVMLLDEQEQATLIEAIRAQWMTKPMQALVNRLEHGDEYWNETDEYVRKTLAKRRLEAEIRRLNARLADLDAALVEEWTEQGRSKDGHAATGATLFLRQRVHAQLDVDTKGLPKDQADSIRRGVKAQAGAVLAANPETAGIVRPDFNLNTLSAIYAERIRDYNDEQRELPEHERVPRDPQDFLPAELRGLLVIDATPHITVLT